MSKMTAILAIDQGTTSTRAMVFALDGTILAQKQEPLPQIFPQSGWVEHDPLAIWSAVRNTSRAALAEIGDRAVVKAIGITNQRETTVLWDRVSGQPIHNAIVWQDRRGAALCQRLEQEGHLPAVQRKTGLLLDSYFSAVKIAWILDNVPGARARAEQGQLAFGTIDCFLLWRLTDGKVHATDATNASRSLLFNIHTQDWDAELLEIFNIPASLLPQVRDSAGHFGDTAPESLGITLPIMGIAGDQQAALVGQACLAPGMAKCTFGTGAFMLLNTGTQAAPSTHRLLTTVGYRRNRKIDYATEGSVFNAGTTIQWLRDKLGVVQTAGETASLAASLSDNRGVYMVPAFTGLGAPYWNAAARGTLVGLTRDTGRAELARAALESVVYQVHDLAAAMLIDGGDLSLLRVDGGMAANDWFLQFLADMLQIPVERPKIIETTALGAALLAGLGAGLYADEAELASLWQRDRIFTPTLSAQRRDTILSGWKHAVRQTLAE